MTKLIDHLRAARGVLKAPRLYAKNPFDMTLASRMSRLTSSGRGFRIQAPGGLADALYSARSPAVQVDCLTRGLWHTLVDDFLREVSAGYLFLVLAPNRQAVKQLYLMVGDDRYVHGEDKLPVTLQFPLRVLEWNGTGFDIRSFDDKRITMDAYATYKM